MDDLQQPRPMVMRTASADSINLRHPTPDLHTLQGAYQKNVERLEQSAEELSQGGSDIGDEIRKLKREQRMSESRRSSMRHGSRERSPAAVPIPNRSRNTSTSSYSNSIVDVNNAARWGGYSPQGYVTSPSASVHSGSWSHASIHRAPSSSRPPRLAGMPEPVQEGRPLDSPLASVASYFPPVPHASQSSLGHNSCHMAEETEKRAEQTPRKTPDEQPEHRSMEEQEHERYEYDGGHNEAEHAEYREYEEHEDGDYRPPSPPDRPPTADTYQQAMDLFADFDGVHFSPTTDEFVALDSEGNETQRISAASLLSQHAPRALRPISYARPHLERT
ncbi:hypothetical protein H2203_001437 [Taxawa tesnikishii (nom. ined.)]|nr:hypothetical protein H2203_001437 [Dothideales sp. JES 119]